MSRRFFLFLACIMLSLSGVLPAKAQPLDTLSLLSRADSLQNAGKQLAEAGDYENALATLTESLEIRRELLGVKHPDYANSLHMLGVCYMYMRDFEKAISNHEEAWEIRREVLGEKSLGYAKSLVSLGACYRAIGDIEKAMEYLTESQGILRAVLGERHPDYAACLTNIGGCHLMLGEYEEAIKYYSASTDIRRETLGESHPAYADGLNDIGVCYLYLGKYDAAIPYITKALEIRREALGEYHADFATSLNNLGSCYIFLGDDEKGITYCTKALAIYRELFGEEHPYCAQTLINLGNSYESLEDYENALSCMEKGTEIYGAVYGENHLDYINGLRNLGNIYAEIGDYEKAGKSFTKALDLVRNLYGEEHPDYASILGNLALCYDHQRDYEKALAYYTKTLELLRAVLGDRHPEYATGLMNLGSFYNEIGDSEKAIAYLTEALDILCEVFEGNHPDKAKILYDIGLCYESQGDYEKAIGYFNESQQMYRDVFGEHHSLYASVFFDLGDDYLMLGNHAESSRCLREYAALGKELVLEAFSYLPGTLRAAFWDPYSNFFQKWLPEYCQAMSRDTSFLRVTYDGALLSKGLLLNAETEIRKMILESGDEELASLYEQYVQERLQLENLYETPVEEREMDADSLAQVCEKLEQSLQKRCRAFGDYTRNLAVSWTDVRDALREGEIAIEFLEINADTDSASYAALTLKRDYESPHYVDLFAFEDLAALKEKHAKAGSAAELYRDVALYNLVWKPLSSEMEEVKTLYFGPTGELYQTAIEYAFTGSGPLADEKNVYRLSSTRQLALPHERGELRRSAVFGGFHYGMSEAALLSDSRKYALREETRGVSFSVDSLDFRGAGAGAYGVSDLPGTEKEAALVSKLLRRRGMEVREITGEAGTEASFKDLDGRGENVIHIATHGFYWEGDTRSSERSKEDASMTRSGLLFSGANNALKRGYVRQEGVEDGILTAQEIAQLDFRSADLIVLSACQTGLGEVSGEGVFGLQRGFKKAGVKSILMSLWEVDDEATQLLMTQFYKGLARGLSKTDALKAAQAAVRTNKSRDFSSPYYWAAFILLDGKE